MPAITTAALAVAGVGMSAYGAYESYQGSKSQAEASKNIAGLEMQQEAVRRQAMELQAKRQTMEIVRTSQRARSMALTTANAQTGSTVGSGLAGGYGQISGQTGVNLLGVSQNLGFAEQMFGLNAQISSQKMNIADAQSQQALGAGLSSFGNSLMNSAGTFGKISAGFGGFGNGIGSYGGSVDPYVFGNRVMGPR